MDSRLITSLQNHLNKSAIKIVRVLQIATGSRERGKGAAKCPCPYPYRPHRQSLHAPARGTAELLGQNLSPGPWPEGSPLRNTCSRPRAHHSGSAGDWRTPLGCLLPGMRTLYSHNPHIKKKKKKKSDI